MRQADIVSMPYNELSQQQCLSRLFLLFYHFLLENQLFSRKKCVGDFKLYFQKSSIYAPLQTYPHFLLSHLIADTLFFNTIHF